MLQDAFDKGMQREAEVVLEGRLEEANHLRHLDDVRSEKIREPNPNIEGGPVARSEVTSKRGSTRLGPTASVFCTATLK